MVQQQPFNFMVNRWGNSGKSGWLCFGGSKITADGDCSHEIKRRLLLGRKVMTNLDSVLKSRDITLLTKVLGRMVVPVVAQMEELDYKEGWVPKNRCFLIVVPEKTLESLFDCKGIKPVTLKEINVKYSLEWLKLKLKLKFQYFSPLLWRSDSLEKSLILEKTEGQRRRGQQRMR